MWKYMDNMSQALKDSEYDNGNPKPVKDKDGKIIGFCGILMGDPN